MGEQMHLLENNHGWHYKIVVIQSPSKPVCKPSCVWDQCLGGGAAHESHKLHMRPREGVDLVIGRIIFRVCNEENDIVNDTIPDSPM